MANQLKALADQGAEALLGLDLVLDRLWAELERMEPELAARCAELLFGQKTASALLFTPLESLGGRSPLQCWADDEREPLEKWLQSVGARTNG